MKISSTTPVITSVVSVEGEMVTFETRFVRRTCCSGPGVVDHGASIPWVSSRPVTGIDCACAAIQGYPAHGGLRRSQSLPVNRQPVVRR
jgi:hypothetical protein